MISSIAQGISNQLRELTRVTRKCLGDNEEAEEVPFVIVGTSQKIELSVRCVSARNTKCECFQSSVEEVVWKVIVQL